MGTHRYGQPGEESEGSEEEHPPGRAPADHSRVHVTLDNLIDLANFDGTVLSGYGATNGRMGSPGLAAAPATPETGAAPGVPLPPAPAVPVIRPYEDPPAEPGPVPDRRPSPEGFYAGTGTRDPDTLDSGAHPTFYAGSAPPPSRVYGVPAAFEPPPAIDPPAPPAIEPSAPPPPALEAPAAGALPAVVDAPPEPSPPAVPADPSPPAVPADPSRPDGAVTSTGSTPAVDLAGYREFWGSADNLPVPVATPEADVAAPRRAVWARPAERWLLELLALGGAAMAFVVPSVWLITVLVAVVAGATVSFARSGRSPGSLPTRVVARSARLLLPRSSLWLPVFLSRTVLAAVLLPGAYGAATWLVDHGRTGAVAAARAGAWDDGFRVFVALLCAMLLTSVGEGRRRRAAAVRQWAAPATDGTLVILATSCVAVVVLALAAVPHPVDPLASRADGLAFVPPAAREAADRVRDDIVTSELDVLVSCLSGRSDTRWSWEYTAGNALAESDVARLSAPEEPPPVDLATALMAAHNQVAPWVEAIEIEWDDQVLLRLDRTELLKHRPVIDKDRLIAATDEGEEWLVVTELDVTTGLRCSAGPVA